MPSPLKVEKIWYSETQAAHRLGYKNAQRFRKCCVVSGLITASHLPGKKFPVYSKTEVDAILQKTKECNTGNHIGKINKILEGVNYGKS